MAVYINIDNPFALKIFVDCLSELIFDEMKKGYKTVVFLCVGTDRSTGDSLGPIVGYKLSPARLANTFIHGTLDSPVHAKNLIYTLEHIRKKYPSPLIIAIDACLGSAECVGCISVGRGGIKPGAAVNKELPLVGNIHITGIVNSTGGFDFLMLQNTRLNTVMKMADIISSGIMHILQRENHKELFNMLS